jgi:hypothetical protein
MRILKGNNNGELGEVLWWFLCFAHKTNRGTLCNGGRTRGGGTNLDMVTLPEGIIKAIKTLLF